MGRPYDRPMMIDRVEGRSPSVGPHAVSLRKAVRELIKATPADLAAVGGDAARASARAVIARDRKDAAAKAKKKRAKQSRKANRGK